jgi:hypothetical protein
MSPRGSLSGSNASVVDANKRYDVYCSERNERIVVYRNVIFKGAKQLFEEQFGVLSFLEIEQSNGQSLFLQRVTIIKFCEHGVELCGEIIAEK